MQQLKQSEWHQQWQMFYDNEVFLFKDWIYPNTLDDFKDKQVLECGCGAGQHTSFIAPYAREIVAVGFNTLNISKKLNKDFNNISFSSLDIAKMNLERQFDIVFSIGVIHHTDNPEATMNNLKRHTKQGGRLIIWVYSEEGNFLVKNIIEPARKAFLRNISRKKLNLISSLITFSMYMPVYALYKLPLRFLPYYEYFENFRKLSFTRNNLNVFDKLNAPQVQFISKQRAVEWFNEKDFKNIHISSYKGVSWRASGTKK